MSDNTHQQRRTRLRSVAGIVLGCALLAGCGIKGSLEPPPQKAGKDIEVTEDGAAPDVSGDRRDTVVVY